MSEKLHLWWTPPLKETMEFSDYSHQENTLPLQRHQRSLSQCPPCLKNLALAYHFGMWTVSDWMQSPCYLHLPHMWPGLLRHSKLQQIWLGWGLLTHLKIQQISLFGLLRHFKIQQIWLCWSLFEAFEDSADLTLLRSCEAFEDSADLTAPQQNQAWQGRGVLMEMCRALGLISWSGWVNCGPSLCL